MEANNKVYIQQGDSSRGKDIINELIKYGAKSTSVLCSSNNASDYYYYIDKKNNIRITDDIELLKDAGYKMIPLPPTCDILPFKSSDELKKACQLHGNMVRNKCGYSLFDIDRIIKLIKAYHSEEVFKHLVEFYEFEDETPCGLVIKKQQ